MNPDEHKMDGDFLGHIPRKKKPKAAAPPAAAQAAEDIPIPRKKKPKMLLHRAQEQERAAASSSGGERGGHHHYGGQQRKKSYLKSASGSGSLPYLSERKPSGSVLERSNTSGPVTSETSRVRIVSETPFVVRIKTKDIPFTTGTASVSRSSMGRRTGSSSSTASRSTTNKRQRVSAVSYQELEDTDSDDFMTEEEEQELLRKRAKKKRRKLEKVGGSTNEAAEEVGVAQQSAMAVTLAPVNPNVIESPPAGVLSTLWYSRECFLHVFVMEKIYGWKTRPKVQLVEENHEQPKEEKIEDQDETVKPLSLTTTRSLELAEAIRLQRKALATADVWADPKKRMEISRINPSNCPFVMGMAEAASQTEKGGASGKKKSYKLQSVASDEAASTAAGSREEVLLVKWRGRSHMHCSWERASDVQRLDPSTSSTARNKIRRFYQNQEITYGSNWKHVLEEERATAASIHSHGISGIADNKTPSAMAAAEDEADEVEEHFSPQCLEIERVLVCDENEMNMEVLAKQRAINIRDEQEELNRKERGQQEVEYGNAATGAVSSKKVAPQEDVDVPWDPEDNVRYVVKWKGLPYAEMTWEYWRDIKRDAVDEAEDFWFRQRAPDLEEARQITNRPHPHIRDFKKLQESPAYGLSKRCRPVAKLEGEDDDMPVAATESDPGFRLRSYQLEGVNWLLFNWWNRRSCILADEMVSGRDCFAYCNW